MIYFHFELDDYVFWDFHHEVLTMVVIHQTIGRCCYCYY